jgi:uncharacterized membrane protein YagU involved in acid resistance
MASIFRQACRGAVAGFAATGPMSIFMAASHEALPEAQQTGLPPRQITDRVLAKADLHDDVDEPERQGITAAAHFAYGTAAGAVYGVLAHALRPPPVLGGVAYGLAVWAGSYLGLLPATGLYRSATREPAGRNVMMIGAHVVWGAVLGLLADGLLETKSENHHAPRDGAAGVISAVRPTRG